jgi:hypothetical protein
MSATNYAIKPYAPDAAADHLNAPPAQPIKSHAQPRALNFAPAETARLRWYEAAIAAHDERERSRREEEQMLMMRRPLTTEQAYGRFGLLLGTLPPAAIFGRVMFDVGVDSGLIIIFLICLVMNVVCALVGWRMGLVAGRIINEVAHASRWRYSLSVLLAALCWSAGTGGAVCFIIGAYYGAAVAIPVALIGFALFAPLHRLLARGGMIDAPRFWPVACGVTLSIAALILRLGS